MGEWSQLFKDFAFFTRHYLAVHECDPEYPVLRALQAAKCADEEDALWHSLLYMAYGEVLAGHVAWMRCPVPSLVASTTPDDWKLPTALERRGLRSPIAMQRHVTSLANHIATFGSIQGWLSDGFIGNPEVDWQRLHETILGVWANGRWAAYTTAEMLICVRRFPIQTSDLGNADSSGPRFGLAHLFGPVVGNDVKAIRLLNAQGTALHEYLQTQGVHARWEELETVLCNFHELVTGHLYIGRGIDKQWEYIQTFQARGFHRVADDVLAARRRALPIAYLGEVGGWPGVDHARKQVYALTGKIVLRGGSE